MTFSQLFKHLRPYVYPYRWIVFVTLLLTLVGSFVGQINALVLKYTVDSVNDLVVAGDGLKEGGSILLFILVAFLGKEVISVCIQLGQQYYGEKLRIVVSRDLAQSVIEKILTYRLAFFTASPNESGKLQTRINKGVESLTRLIQNFFIDILPLFATAIVALGMMFYSSLYAGLIAMLVIPVYMYVSQKQAKRLSGSRREIRTFIENKSQGIITILTSIPVIKSFIREDLEAIKQLKLQEDLTASQMKTRKIKTAFEASKSMIEQIGLTFVVFLTVYFILKGEMTIGTIMFNIMLFSNVSAPIRQLHRIYDQMNDALIYSEGFFEILKADDQIEKSGTYKPEKVEGKFELKNVDFTYPNNTKALRNVNMIIAPHQITALVGLSGAGKSTIINLLDRFYEPDSGEILLDGIPLRDYDLRFLRDNIGLVLQRNHIFSGSIEENIRYGKPNATHEEIVDAAKRAYIHDQVMEMPAQYDTIALELSGGQQQRVAIARTFLKNPPIIFLDEPTASLDAVSTEQIKNSIDAIKKNRTVIIISHSISQIIDSDIIYTMKNGRVMEAGTHEQIYGMQGTYKEIFDSMARSLNLDKIAKTMNN